MAIQTDQIVSDDTLKSLGSTSREQLKSIFAKLNNELESPLRLHATFPTPDSKLNFSASSIDLGDGAKKSIPALKSQVFSISASSIDFQTQAVVGTFAIVWPVGTVGQFIRAGFTLLSSGTIQVLFSAESATLGGLANAGTLFVKSGIALGFIDLECTAIGKWKTAGSATDIIENVKISRFSSGSGGGTGTGTNAGGGELSDLMYSASLRDSFSDQLDGTTPTDVGAGKTDTTIYDSSNELVRLSYDASKTVTGVGTAMTLSSAPSFTIKDGDVLIVNGEVRKFTVTNQTTIVLESAFSSDPTASACCVSQAVHTVDLNNFTNNGLGLAVSSQFSGDIDEVMLGYEDSETLGDIIPNFGSSVLVAFSASTDANNWTTIRTRVSSLSDDEVAVTCPTSNPNLYLRFFANKTSGSGAVNLLSYKVFFHKIIGQTAGSQYYTAFARPTSSIAQNCAIGLVGGKTRFTFTFPYTRGLNSGEASGSVLEVIANGQIIPRYVAGVTDTTQAYFTEINDNTIEMDTDYSSAGIDFQFKVQRVSIIDNNSQNTSKIALHDDLLDQTLEAQVIPLFRSAVNGAPSSTQFRSDITNRASIPDLSSMLSVQMGTQRMMIQEIYPIQNESGPSGQMVFGAVNDKFNQIRFVGSGWYNRNDSLGPNIFTSVANDYVEIVFYGTGLNLLTRGDTTLVGLTATIDGGDVNKDIPDSSQIIGARNYSENKIWNIASNLAFGFHTIKIKITSNNLGVFGFEVLTETTSLRVMPGTVAKGKYKNTLSALQAIAYDSNFESGALGTRGGCVLVYLKNDGTIGKAVTPTDATPLYLTNTNHANEEIIRTHNWREFGCGRSDDFSGAITSSSSRVFTLDDGVTTLTGSSCASSGGSVDGVQLTISNDSFATFTFVGTGLDIVISDSSNGGNDSYTYSIDGATALAWPYTSGSTSIRTQRICSGLPYGTHTFKVNRVTATTWDINFYNFIVYAPKKPSLPVGSIELAQYYKMADFIANTTAGQDTIATGVLRKMPFRENAYVGTWTIDNAFVTQGYIGAGQLYTTVSASYVEHTFFGTGFDLRFKSFTSYGTGLITLNGTTLNATNFPSASFGTVGLTTGFNSSTGILSWVNSSNVSGAGFKCSGLPLAKYTIRIASQSSAIISVEAIDEICPIHAPTINGPYVIQNTLALGNNGFLDLRKFNKKDILVSNESNTSQCVKLTTSQTTSTTFIPNPDMSLTHNCKTGKVRISHTGLYDATSGYWTIVIDGKIVKQGIGLGYTTSYGGAGICITEKLSIGQHKIDVYYRSVSGTTTAYNDGLVTQILTVEDV